MGNVSEKKEIFIYKKKTKIYRSIATCGSRESLDNFGEKRQIKNKKEGLKRSSEKRGIKGRGIAKRNTRY